MEMWQEKLIQRLKFIYKTTISDEQIQKFLNLVEINKSAEPLPNELWDEKDIALITYGDSILDERKPLETLHSFLKEELNDEINTVHILPFFPFSSDDGFSVIDFKEVNPELGNWKDIERIADSYKLMADLVINHASSQGQWFKNFLKSEGEGTEYFISEDPSKDLSQVTRPRSTPLLTPYKTKEGIKHVWTTFSADQVDLNFSNPDLLIAMFDVFISYLKHGSTIIRLDAIAFLWKNVGTTCLHLPETHEVVKLMRDVGELVKPGSIILTETNVPNKENLSYFGNNNEAHMVYQFSLPPLLLHALNTGNGSYLTEWAKSIPNLEPNQTFFNFTSSHDGIGVRPLEGLLPEEEKKSLFADIKSAGGLISMKSNTDGTESPYELNITYYDALKLTRNGEDNKQNDRFICSQTIMLALKGMPAFYIHSLLASPNYYAGVKETGRARTINREKLILSTLLDELSSESDRKTVVKELKRLIAIRKKHKAFHPSAEQEIINLDKSLFAFLRKSLDGDELLSISNLSDNEVSVNINEIFSGDKNDIISDTRFSDKTIQIQPYQTLWLTK